jgi:indolepyruvate ferredoxin oxidoreductase beta subunit
MFRRRCDLKFDIVIAGVGGQGVLSVAAAIAAGAMEGKLFVKESEVHGMAQKGGAVMASLRLSDHVIASDIIPHGTADLILGMEPLESIRYLPYLDAEGTLVTSSNPIRNIPDYPDLRALLDTIARLHRSITVDSERLAREAGSARAANMVILGAAIHLLPIEPAITEAAVRAIFEEKGKKAVNTNLRALWAGRDAAR